MSDDIEFNIHHGLLQSYEDILDITVDFVSELGTTNMSVAELLKLEVGSVIDLEKPAGESVELISIKEFLAKARLWFMKKISL